MAQHHNKDLKQEVDKLKEEGFSYRQIGQKLHQQYGKSKWPENIEAARNKAWRYHRQYNSG